MILFLSELTVNTVFCDSLNFRSKERLRLYLNQKRTQLYFSLFLHFSLWPPDEPPSARKRGGAKLQLEPMFPRGSRGLSAPKYPADRKSTRLNSSHVALS